MTPTQPDLFTEPPAPRQPSAYQISRLPKDMRGPVEGDRCRLCLGTEDDPETCPWCFGERIFRLLKD
jgi:hypothetical protein